MECEMDKNKSLFSLDLIVGRSTVLPRVNASSAPVIKRIKQYNTCMRNFEITSDSQSVAIHVHIPIIFPIAEPKAPF